jgi:hypothetical protein
MMVAISEREKQVSDVGRDDIAVRGIFLIKVAGWLQRYDERVFLICFLCSLGRKRLLLNRHLLLPDGG